MYGCVLEVIKKQRESAKNEQQQKFIGEEQISCKIDPEGTLGPIWPEMVPFFSSCSWLYRDFNQIVNM